MPDVNLNKTDFEKPISIGFLLLDKFTMISLACAVEPLRMANQLSARSLFEWKLISEKGDPVCASDGIRFYVDAAIFENQDFDVLFVAGGVDVEEKFNKETLSWLRNLGKKGVQLGGICTGTFVLAAAGLLNGYNCSVHWESKAAISELYPLVRCNDHLFTVDRQRLTATGGTGPLDMMINIIGGIHGITLAREISEMFIIERIRGEGENQKIPLGNRLGVVSQKLIDAVGIMEANIEDPIEIVNLAELVDLSRRQLERLFKANLEVSPARYYMNRRLLRSRELLKQTNLSTVDIAALCGFKSTPHFSKCYRDHFGVSPRMERNRHPSAPSQASIDVEDILTIPSPVDLEPSLGSVKSDLVRG